MADMDAVLDALIDAIQGTAAKLASNPSTGRAHSEAVHNLAEAYAWVVAPSNAHGGASSAG